MKKKLGDLTLYEINSIVKTYCKKGCKKCPFGELSNCEDNFAYEDSSRLEKEIEFEL